MINKIDNYTDIFMDDIRHNLIPQLKCNIEQQNALQKIIEMSIHQYSEGVKNIIRQSTGGFIVVEGDSLNITW